MSGVGGLDMKDKLRWIFAALVLLLGFVGLWIGRNALFEKVEVEISRSPSAEVQLNRYLALEELLDRSGLPTRTATSLEALPPTDHVLWWLADTRRAVPAKLLYWVERGGHLIVEPLPTDDPASDPVVTDAGIGVFFADEADDDDHLSAQEFQIERPPWPKFWVMEEGIEVVASEGETDAAWNVTVGHGEGLLTVLNHSDFLRNDQIAKKDHALLVWHLVRADEGRGGVTLVTRDPKPSIWLVLSRRAMPVALSLVALSVFGLWAFARRVGPIRPSPSRDRRHLAEHLHASGDFLWQVGCEDVLLASQRAAVAKRLAHGGMHLGIGSASRRQKLMDEAVRAAERAGLDADRVQRALKVREMRDRERFVGVVRILEALRRHRER